MTAAARAEVAAADQGPAALPAAVGAAALVRLRDR
jgi:hypothetical protein